MEETEEEHFFGESLNTDGSKGGLESGASAVISPYSDESDQPNPYMQMDGKAIFDFAVKTVSKSIKALVEEKVNLITSFFIKLIFVFWILWLRKSMLVVINSWQT